MNETNVTVVGNVTADPELRYTQNGIPVANFTVASTERVFDREANAMKDGDTIFYRVAAWRELGEHVANSLAKGQQVIVLGKLKHKPYQTREGQTAYSLEIEPTAIGPSLQFGTTVFTKSAPKGQQAAQPPAGMAQPVQPAAPALTAPVVATQPQAVPQQQQQYVPQAAPVPQGAPVPQAVPAGGVEAMSDDLF